MEIKYCDVDNLLVDPRNPRLGRSQTSKELTQDKILELMSGFTLDELAVSFVENGFWPQEAVIAVKENVYGKDQLVVVEGNRRLAALKCLKRSFDGNPPSIKWKRIVEDADYSEKLFSYVPYIEVQSREEVVSYIGFRHVTGIKQWDPAEKAEYISKMVDSGLTYSEVSNKIGSKAEAVRRNYVSYKMLLQMEEQDEISLKHVEEKFSVLFLSLREVGIKKYLNIDISNIGELTDRPIPEEHVNNLIRFAGWLFGTDKKPPLFSDSRNIGIFGRILASSDGVQYLETAENPSFEEAIQKAKAYEEDLVVSIQKAINEVEAVLARVYRYEDSNKLREKVIVLNKAVSSLSNHFQE